MNNEFKRMYNVMLICSDFSTEGSELLRICGFFFLFFFILSFDVLESILVHLGGLIVELL